MVDQNRSLLKYILLSLITCGIYGYYFIYKLAKDVNLMCSGDGEETGGLAVYILLCMITCGLYSWWWMYKLGNRLSVNASKYGLSFQENGTTIIMWCLVGVVLCGIGQWIAMHMIIKNTNAMAIEYNKR